MSNTTNEEAMKVKLFADKEDPEPSEELKWIRDTLGILVFINEVLLSQNPQLGISMAIESGSKILNKNNIGFIPRADTKS